ncbi:MAG: MBL fold metallo-hydrolase [Alphaproteobacteria bacterium]|nr:MBL fold metallo-hydrolase [Alphaproteobacteria bacterium]
MAIPFNRQFDFEYGAVTPVTPLIRRIVARNPSPFTFHGTGTYIVGQGEVAVIDPGPDLPDHVDAISQALVGETISHILVTHTHCDHSPAARRLQRSLGGTTYGFGRHGSGRPETGGDVEEGADHAFTPDIRVGDGDLLQGPGWTIEAVTTPGHCSNHVCYRLREEQALFTGDHIMAWSTTVVSPPDGDMQAYLRSLHKLLHVSDHIYWPTHGGPVREPHPFVRAYIAHREERERQIETCLASGIELIAEMVARLYANVDRRLHAAAARSVHAHLIHLVETDRAHCDGPPELTSRYRRPSTT